jgi:hypothetical protein
MRAQASPVKLFATPLSQQRYTPLQRKAWALMAEHGGCMRAQASPVKLFATPLSQQRYAFAATLMAQRRARAFVDLGCGEARLMEHFCKQARVPLSWSRDFVVSPFMHNLLSRPSTQ